MRIAPPPPVGSPFAEFEAPKGDTPDEWPPLFIAAAVAVWLCVGFVVVCLTRWIMGPLFTSESAVERGMIVLVMCAFWPIALVGLVGIVILKAIGSLAIVLNL